MFRYASGESNKNSFNSVQFLANLAVNTTKSYTSFCLRTEDRARLSKHFWYFFNIKKRVFDRKKGAPVA